MMMMMMMMMMTMTSKVYFFPFLFDLLCVIVKLNYRICTNTDRFGLDTTETCIPFPNKILTTLA